ncbi:MAG: DUF885 domain-containing protein [Actinomycetota bacterium]
MTRPFDDVVEAYLDDLLRENPVLATALGADGYDELLPDLSADGFARRATQEDEWLTRLGAQRDLTLDEEIDRDLIRSILRGNQITRTWTPWRRQPDTYLNPGLAGVFTLFLHRAQPEPELAAAAEARLRAVPAMLDEGKRNLDPALVAPIFAQRALGQCRAAITYARTLVPREVGDEAARTRVAEAGETAAHAFEDFAEFLQKLAAGAQGDYAIGEQMYSDLLREKELLGYGAREMRERGRAAYDDLSADMSRRARDMRGTDNWREVLEELAADHPESPDAMRATYEDWTERARQFLKDRALVTMPAGERCLVEPSPHFQRPVLAVASYSSPQAFKPSLTGHFFVPFPPDGTSGDETEKRLRTNGNHSIPAISVHEAYPGHHWHMVTRYANPRRIRSAHGSSYFSEGWALYAEVMMREEGFFEQPSHELCQVDARIFRAARIIVDTSLHIGDMTFEGAVKFMMEKSSLSEPTARAEVGRYCSWPTQASSYLTGSLEIERIRERWFAEERGDLRAFHDGICATGALPVALAERALLG